MNWQEGYSAAYYLTVIDPKTWRDLETVDITGGRITKTTDNLMESADIDVTQNLGEKWVRIWVEGRQIDDGDREALFTGILQTPGVSWDGNRSTYSAECYSVLKPASDVLLPRGWYVLAGMNGARAAANLLSVGSAPVIYDDASPALFNTIVAEDGETNLTMAWKIVNAIGWRIRIDGRGTINICQQATEPSVRLDTQNLDIVEPAITDDQDFYSCPNVFRATSGDLTAVARDEDSITERGREIWAEEKDCALNSGESISSYAKRRLKELQSPSRKVKYSRRNLPDITTGDMVNLNFPKQSIFGNYIIKKQSIDLGYAAKVAEEVEKVG